MSTYSTQSGAGLGHRLAEQLSIEILGTEGHDLRIPCPNPTCSSSDAGRIHQTKGVASCYSCGGAWSPFQLAELVLGDRQQAKAVMVELGIFEPGKKPAKHQNGSHKKMPPTSRVKKKPDMAKSGVPTLAPETDSTEHMPCFNSAGKLLFDPIERVATAKEITKAGLLAFGARAILGTSEVLVPSFAPDLAPRREFALTPLGKGRWPRRWYDGERVAGIFMPIGHDEQPLKPSTDQTWVVAEGVKDCAALHCLGYLAAGLPTNRMAEEFAPLFSGVHVVLMPDRDCPGVTGARASFERLLGFAASIRVAELPLPLQKSKGGDVRDCLKIPNGEQLVRNSIENATLAADYFSRPELIAEIESLGGKIDGSGDDGDDELDNEHENTGPAISNFILEQDEAGEWKPSPLTMSDILARFNEATGNWPRRVGNDLFAVDNGRVHWLDSVSATFGWAATTSKQLIEWRRGTSFVERADAFSEIRRNAICYSAVENLPHFPPIIGHYYAAGDFPNSGGAALNWLLDRFCPETPTDRELLLSLFLTPFWGGRPGGRPCFVVTSDAGRGVGKTTVVSMLSRILGGMLDFSANEDIATIKQRLLSPEGVSSRLALLDNLKSLRFSWAELEALITGPVISGKKLYTGESSRPNTITWVVTLNGASLSADMSQRCVILKLAASIKSGSWQDETARFIDENRRQIIGDILELLAGPTKPLARHSRWGDWEDGVLSRLDDPVKAQQVIAERQQVADCEHEESELLVTHFRNRLIDLGYSADEEWVHIPTKAAAEWFCEATGERKSVTGVSRILKQLVNEGRVTEIQIDPGHKYGRGFLWQGCQSTVNSARHYDLQDRIEKLLNEKFKKSKPTEF